MTQHATFDGPNLPATLPDLDGIEAGFNRALDLYTSAFDKIAAADAAIREARAAIEAVTPGAQFHFERDAREVEEFNKAVQLPNRDLYVSTARKLINLRCWHYVVDRCGLRQLMDAQAKKELDDQLRYIPDRSTRHGEVIDAEEMAKGAPLFTADTVRATLAKFQGEAQTIWRRGIANAFSSLDRRFRSHDGFKIGSRIILTRLCNDYGSVDSYGARGDTFRDIERTFTIMDGRDPRHAQSNFLWHIGNERRGFRPSQSEHHNDYFKVVIYKNGNAHLWFKRDDLVELVNKELAAYYGEVIGDGNPAEPDIFENRAVTQARAFGFFPTPDNLATKIAARIPYRDETQRILEPSAGTGALGLLAAKPVAYRDEVCRRVVDCIEIQPDLATGLRQTGAFNSVTCADFLKVQPDPNRLYDGVLMNPPFDRERDIDHVTHALKFLKPDGWLLAIMSAGTEFRETRKAAAFRKLLADRGGWTVDLPPGSFASVGTYVNTVLVGIGCSRVDGSL